MVGIAGSRRRQQTSTFRLVRPGRNRDLPLVSVRTLVPLAEYVRAKLSALAERFDETSGHTADPAVRAGIAGSTADLGAEIVADDDADNTTTAGEAGGTATPVNAGRSRRQQELSGGHHDEHAAQFGKPGDDGASRQAGLYLRAPIACSTLSSGNPRFLHPIDPHAIELLDVNGEALPGTLSPLAGGTERIGGSGLQGLEQRPAFARLRFANDSFSAPAVVTVVDALRETVREARGKRAKSSALRLSEETEEGLWLLEVLDSLEAAEETQNGTDDPGARRIREKAGETAAEAEFRTLDYEQFIAGRRLRYDDSAVNRNSLASSELSLVRGFLNRILSIGETTSDSSSEIEEAIAAGLDLGDETANAEDALERGEEFSGASPPVGSEQPDAEAEGRKRAQVKATRDQIVQAVDRFNERIRLKAEIRKITKFDILRLRAMLMIIAAADRLP